MIEIAVDRDGRLKIREMAYKDTDKWLWSNCGQEDSILYNLVLLV